MWENDLMTLSGNIFIDLTKLEVLLIWGNNLKTLPAYIFKSQTNLIELQFSTNPWDCDCNLFENLRSVGWRNLHFGDGRCKDGKSLQKAVRDPIKSMILINYSRVLDYLSRKYFKNCLMNSTNDMAEVCLSIDCSSNNLKEIPYSLGDKLHRLPALQKIELNIENNSIERFPNSTISGFNPIAKISAKNNSIKTIAVDNFPPNLIEIDLSENKLKSLSAAVMNHLSNTKMLKKVVLGQNPWQCDDTFKDFIRLNGDKVDQGNITCVEPDDGHSTAWITFFLHFFIGSFSDVLFCFQIYHEERIDSWN